MQAGRTFEFARAPAIWSAYPKILLSRKPSLVPAGGTVPRIEARLASVTVDRRHLTRYAKLCGAAAGSTLPIAYPHVMAAPLHLAMLAGEAFPVRLLGLVHVRNRIAMHRPLSVAAPAAILSWIEGHRHTDRGQEFDLETRYVVAGETLWDETCTFLARRRGGGGDHKSTPPRTAERPATPPGASTRSFDAPAGLGRRYAFVSGDMNPIHMSDLSARMFGFRRAIAHGMWSLARTAAELGSEDVAGPCELTVSFKLPIPLPSRLVLQHWAIDGGNEFTLRDAQGEKPHLAGTLGALR